jgi:cytosine/adenosine deaminase-related metal-dependent hydrolase
LAKQVLSNAILLEGDELEVTHGYLVIRGGVIEEIGEGVPPKRAKDLKRAFILPPFINAHTHVADSVAKDIYLGKAQPQVVGPKGTKFRELRSRTEKEVIASVRATLKDMLRTGTLAHCDFREGGLAGVELLRRASDSPVKSIILGRPSAAAELDEILKASDGIGLPSLEEFESPALERTARRVLTAKKILAVHVAETADAQKASINATGKSEVKRALELNPSFVAHAAWGTEEDFDALRKASIPTVFCARANSLLGAGVPPIHLALAKGAKFCLGTDNATVCQPNMFGELAFAWACLRRASSDAGGEEARELLWAATVGPLRLFDLPWGPIKEGNPATFMVLARRHNLVNLTDVHAGIVNRARADNIREIYLHGKIFKLKR